MEWFPWNSICKNRRYWRRFLQVNIGTRWELLTRSTICTVVHNFARLRPQTFSKFIRPFFCYFKNDFLNFSLSAIVILEFDTVLKKDEESKVLIIQVIISFASLSASSRSRLAKKGFRSPKQANGGGPPRLAPQQFAHLAPIDCFGGDWSLLLKPSPSIYCGVFLSAPLPTRFLSPSHPARKTPRL